MNRRALLAGASLFAAPRALAQPMPFYGPVGGLSPNAGPLWPVDPLGKTLGLSFMTPGTLDPRITFTRGSTATYFDATGTLQTVSGNTPRWDYNPSTLALNGLLIEEARTNVLLNSATLGTQSVAVTAQAYTLSFYGTGTITKSGTASGALVGTGAFPQRVSQTFTPTAGTLTLTVTGSVLNAQLEAGSFATSWIPTTAAAVTRSQEQCSILPANMGFYVAPNGSWALEYVTTKSNASANTTALIMQHNNINGPIPMYLTTTSGIAQWDGIAAMSAANAASDGVINKGATTVLASTTAGTACLNGGTVASGTGLSSGYTALGTSGIDFLRTNEVSTSQTKAGYIRRVRYWPRILSNIEMQQVTT